MLRPQGRVSQRSAGEAHAQVRMLLLGLPTRGSSTCLNLRAALVVSPEQHDWGNDTAM